LSNILPFPPVPAPIGARRKHRGGGHLRTIMALIMREMTARFGSSPGGYIWALAQPLGRVIVLSFIFQLVLRSPSLGNSFILFYATGYLVFILSLNISQIVATALKFSQSPLKYPAVSWIDALAGRIILNTLTGLVVACLILGGIIVIVDPPVVLGFGAILTAYLMAFSTGIGVGLMNCVIIGFFPVWNIVWKIMKRPLFLVSGVIYIYEDLPLVAQDILWYNPLIHVTGCMRSGFYAIYEPQFISPVYVFGLSLPMIALGLMLMRRFHREIMERR